MPWLNGGGSTIEIIAWPARDRWDWRLSVADVDHAGPFSTFENIDRTIALLTGNGFALTFGSGTTQSITDTYSPYSFPGDEDCSCRLVDGPVQDINLMVRRGTGAQRLVFVEISDSVELTGMVTGDIQVAVVVAGRASLDDQPLERLDAIKPTRPDQGITVLSPESAILAVVVEPT